MTALLSCGIGTGTAYFNNNPSYQLTAAYASPCQMIYSLWNACDPLQVTVNGLISESDVYDANAHMITRNTYGTSSHAYDLTSLSVFSYVTGASDNLDELLYYSGIGAGFGFNTIVAIIYNS